MLETNMVKTGRPYLGPVPSNSMTSAQNDSNQYLYKYEVSAEEQVVSGRLFGLVPTMHSTW